nr:hypothetical protein [Mycoplasmopsis bovis]
MKLKKKKNRKVQINSKKVTIKASSTSKLISGTLVIEKKDK